MSQTPRQKIGKSGEQVASNYLVEHGFQILERNHRTPYGEIDLVARREEKLIFIEVKTRASKTLGLPEISVTPRKQQHMIQSAQYYIQQHPIESGSWQIDVVSVELPTPDHPLTITHFENAIS